MPILSKLHDTVNEKSKDAKIQKIWGWRSQWGLSVSGICKHKTAPEERKKISGFWEKWEMGRKEIVLFSLL